MQLERCIYCSATLTECTKGECRCAGEDLLGCLFYLREE